MLEFQLKRAGWGIALLMSACTAAEKEPATEPVAPPDEATAPGVVVDVAVRSEALTALKAQVQESSALNAAQLQGRYPTAFDSDLGYDPTAAAGYELIAASGLSLDAAEEAAFAQHGVVISARHAFSTFSYGYHSIYAEDLPVYVSADSVLDTLHRSYDDILKDLELETLIPTLQRYLQGMRAALPAAEASLETLADADFFLAMAESLLAGAPVPPGLPQSFQPDELQSFFDAAMKANGEQTRELFGFKRRLDFSQFKPRGHYTDSEELSRYFRVMMWLGRIDLRMLETQDDGSQVLRRNQVEIAMLLHALMTPELAADWSVIDRTVTAFVGEHDYMTAPQLEKLMQDLGITQLQELSTVADDVLAQAIVDGNYGEQRIASHVMINGGVVDTLPLSASFALFGQRYVVDSYVFSEVVYDRVNSRVLPDPMDAAFAALGNNQALALLDEPFADDHAAKLGALRATVDAHPRESWESSLYTAWLGALRELSAGQAPAGGSGLPSVAQSDAWGRRLLNTQLGSWAQLRHDTLLYAKQSYTASSECEYPAAYVDPYPAFWAELLQYAERGSALLDALQVESAVLDEAQAYFTRFSEIVTVLHAMSEHQATGMPHSQEHLDFINQAVLIYSGGSGPPTIEGWYHRLLYRPDGFSDVDLTIADVHTDPGGQDPFPREPSVLHVATSYPRLMVVAVESCDGARAYAGPVFTYKEYIADGLTRLDDEWWTELVNRDPTRDPTLDESWMAPVLPGAP